MQVSLMNVPFYPGKILLLHVSLQMDAFKNVDRWIAYPDEEKYGFRIMFHASPFFCCFYDILAIKDFPGLGIYSSNITCFLCILRIH